MQPRACACHKLKSPAQNLVRPESRPTAWAGTEGPKTCFSPCSEHAASPCPFLCTPWQPRTGSCGLLAPTWPPWGSLFSLQNPDATALSSKYGRQHILPGVKSRTKCSAGSWLPPESGAKEFQLETLKKVSSEAAGSSAEEHLSSLLLLLAILVFSTEIWLRLELEPEHPQMTTKGALISWKRHALVLQVLTDLEEEGEATPTRRETADFTAAGGPLHCSPSLAKARGLEILPLFLKRPLVCPTLVQVPPNLSF